MKNLKRCVAHIILSCICGGLLLIVKSNNETPQTIIKEKEYNTTTTIIQEQEETISMVAIPTTMVMEMSSEITQETTTTETITRNEIETETETEIETISYLYGEYTEEEFYMMCRCIETEVYQCSFEAKTNVASVILNRVIQYQSDPISVVTSPHQFAYFRTEISEDTKQALLYVLENGDTTNGCMAFRSDCCPYEWYDWTYQFSDDAVHYFYK